VALQNQQLCSPTPGMAGLVQRLKVSLSPVLLSLCRLLNSTTTVQADEKPSKLKSLLPLSHWGRRVLTTPGHE